MTVVKSMSTVSQQLKPCWIEDDVWNVSRSFPSNVGHLNLIMYAVKIYDEEDIAGMYGMYGTLAQTKISLRVTRYI